MEQRVLNWNVCLRIKVEKSLTMRNGTPYQDWFKDESGYKICYKIVTYKLKTVSTFHQTFNN